MRRRHLVVIVFGLFGCGGGDPAGDEVDASTGESGSASESGTTSESETASESGTASTSETETAGTDEATDASESETGELPEQSARLRIVNGCDQPMWVLSQVGSGGGTLDAPNQLLLAEQGDFVDYPIPAIGLAATRFWPGFGCDETGNDCAVGQSGGPPSEGFTCPPEGCAPAIDSKFEGTFGCLASVDPADCQDNPSAPGVKLPATDGWDTSMVDGFTVAYEVELLDACPGGPEGGAIDCSGLQLADCPTQENLSTNGQFPAFASVDLVARDPSTDAIAGCYSPCGKLTYSNWGNAPTFAPDASEAEYYCCPTPPIGVEDCRTGPVVDTQFVDLVHQQCPQVYAYAYDDGIGNWSCPAGTRYRVTFYCPQ
ncbi:thaumatin family protein [Nannocystaceae bacterium ST9]